MADRGGGVEDRPGTAPGVVRVKLLGGFEVSVASGAIRAEAWRLRKAAALVKLLALSPAHRLHREQAMELLWPDMAPKAAANNLHHALHVARGVLGPAPTGHNRMPLRHEWVALCPHEDLWVDVEAFEESAATARRLREPAAYREALELYAGDLLPGDRYEDWSAGRRAELRRIYLTLLLERARLHEERNEPGAAIETLLKAVVAEPAHEAAHVGLMRLYAATGQRNRAIEQYERLRRELGAEPGARSRSVYGSVLSGGLNTAEPLADPLAGQTRHNLPRSLTGFVGRDREKREVVHLLGASRLLTLTGAGGSGKTRLAVEAARALVGAYPDGVWLAELASLSDEALVAQEVATVLGVRERPGRPVADTLADALGSSRMLLILDNCEHLVDACAHLTEKLLTSCPGLRILATSREPLGAAGEVTWRVPSLSGPGPRGRLSVGELECHEAPRLFVERARYRNPGFALTEKNARAVAEICHRLEGIPLAIELAAARVELSVEEILARLDDSLRLLTDGVRTAPARQRTLRGSLDWSHHLLGEPERRFFARLSVFSGGWTLEAAEKVASGDGIEERDALGLLFRLAGKSLVVTETGPGTRYRMLEPIRQYAREKLKESGEAGAARRRHTAHYLALAEEAEPELVGGRQEAWLAGLQAEHDNLNAALTYAIETGESETALRLAGALGGFWHMRGHLSEGRRWLEAVLDQETRPKATQVKVLSGAAYLEWEQGEYERAISLSEENLALSRSLGDRSGAGR